MYQYCVLAGKQKIHYSFTDDSEMVEEYDMGNYDILGSDILKNITRYCDHFTYLFHICCCSVNALKNPKLTNGHNPPPKKNLHFLMGDLDPHLIHDSCDSPTHRPPPHTVSQPRQSYISPKYNRWTDRQIEQRQSAYTITVWTVLQASVKATRQNNAEGLMS